MLVDPILSASSAVTSTNYILNLYFKTFSLSLIHPLPLLSPLFVNLMVIIAHLTYFSFNSRLAPIPCPLQNFLLFGLNINLQDMAFIFANSPVSPLSLPQPDDTPVSTIPTSVFYSPPSQLHSSVSFSSPSDLSSLSRSLKQLTSPSILKAKATIWNWWRSKKSSHNTSPSLKHLHLLLLLLRSPSNPLVQVPSVSWEWLISHFPSDKAPTFPIMHDRYFLVPLYLLSQLCHQYQIIHTQTTRPSRFSQFSSPPSHTWQKCRFAAPKIAQHSGVIRSASGEICSTTAQLDTAFRATPPLFLVWFPPPLPHYIGPLSFISMPMLLSPFRPVLLPLLMTSFTLLLPPLILLLAPMVFPTLPGDSAQLLPPFV